MRTAAFQMAVAIVAASAAAAASPALAGTAESTAKRLTVSMAARDSARPDIVVTGRDGKYDRIETSSLRASLDLSAQPTEASSAYKIVRSRLIVKADGMAANEGVDTLSRALPSPSFEANAAYDLPIAANRSTAQHAIALCNAVPSVDRSRSAPVRRAMPVAVAWHVTTGSFSFKWTNYDRVAPSDDILRNPDFYADQVTQSAETLIDADVVCQPLQAPAVAAKPAAGNPVRHVALTPVEEPKTPVAVEQKVSQADTGKPRCDGGMVRQVSTAADNYLCLCPGNTVRIDLGANAFACERRTRR